MIREFQKNDIGQVISIWLSVSIIAHDFIPAEYWQSKVEEMKNIYIPMSKTWVYEDSKNEVKAFISLVDDYVAAIFVDPQHQGNGLGTQLISYVKENNKNLKLQVYKENQASVKFYLKKGFKIEREQTDEDTGKGEYVMIYEK